MARAQDLNVPVSPVAILAVVAASCFWGTTGTVASTISTLNPAVIGASTMGFGGFLMAITAPKKTLSVLRTRGAVWQVIVGGLAIMTYTLVFYSGMAWAGVALGNVLALGSAPVFAGILEWLIDRRPVTPRWVAATIIVILGGVALATGRDLEAENLSHDERLIPLGIAMALLAGFAYALYTFMANRLIAPKASRRSGASLDFRGTISAMQLISALPLLLIVLLAAPTIGSQPLTWLPLAYLAIFPTALGHSLLAFALGRMRASVAGVYSLVEPVVAVILAVTVVGEAVSPTGWVGFAVVLVGIAYLSMPGSGIMPVLSTRPRDEGTTG